MDFCLQLLLSAFLVCGLGASVMYGWVQDRQRLDRLVDSQYRLITAALLAVALLAGLNYFYFSRPQGRYLHSWDLYHTVMSAEYFGELGYSKLYECTIVLDAEAEQVYQEVSQIRDLSNLNRTTRKEVLSESDCNELFSDQRRKEFIEDLRLFNSLNPAGRWRRIFSDKGYNGTPFYTFLIASLLKPFELTRGNLLLLAMLDIGLILVAFLVVSKTFGLQLGLLAFIFFCTSFPNRFEHMGGSLLRFDYIVYLMLAVCCMKSKRHKLAGVFVGLASMVRIFPILFASGLGIKALFDFIQRRQQDKKYRKFFLALAITVAVFFLLSLASGRGVSGWVEFGENMRLHNQNSSGFRIGFKHLFMFHGEMTLADGVVPYLQKTLEFQEVRFIYLLCVLVILGLLILVMNRLNDPNASILFLVVTFFLLFTATRYYYSILVLPFLLDVDFLRTSWARVFHFLLFLITAITYTVYLYNPFPPFIYNYLFSFLLLLCYGIVLSHLTVVHRVFRASEEV